MTHQKKYEYYFKHKSSLNRVIEFLDDKLEEAYDKPLDNLVLQEVYSLTKALRLLDEVEDHIDVLRHIKRDQDNKIQD